MFIETDRVVVVIEGKRTEPGPTRGTLWLPGRHQMIRNLDAAYEIRGARQLFGFFLVEGQGPAGAVPDKWKKVAIETITTPVIDSSLPHRPIGEQAEIAEAFLGVASWKQVLGALSLDLDLPDSSQRDAST